jgi:hypothetical protein
MKKNGWLEAWLMNAFCRKLFRDNHPRKSYKHFFFNTTSVSFLFILKVAFSVLYHLLGMAYGFLKTGLFS